MADELALLHSGATTPKRKRPDEAQAASSEETANSRLFPRSTDEEGYNNSGSGSPRSRMAHQFRGLDLGSGGVVPAAADPSGSPVAPATTATVSVNNISNINNDVVGTDTTSSNTAADADASESAQVRSTGCEFTDDTNGGNVNGLAMRKRQKGPGSSVATPSDSLSENLLIARTKEITPSPTPTTASTPIPVVDIPSMPTTQPTSRRPSLQRALPSINRLTTLKSRIPTPPETMGIAPPPPSTEAAPAHEDYQSKSRGGKKRSSALPKTRREKTGIASPATTPEDSAEEDYVGDEPLDIVDPLRASLTWHEDEITVYDPEDSEDDGEGIDGIGFKPSQPAAEARAAKRRQQLAEYRRREESEARDGRLRRRVAAAAAAVNIPPIQTFSRMASGDDARKVRFREMEPACALVTN